MPAPPCPLQVAEYHVFLDVDFEHLRWKGTIHFEVAGSADAIDLDSSRLTIEGATVGGAPVPAEVDAANERLRLRVPVRGRAAVQVSFAGWVLEKGVVGRYRER